MQRAVGEDNFNIMKVSLVPSLVPHIAHHCGEKWGQEDNVLVQWLNLRKLHCAKGSNGG